MRLKKFTFSRISCEFIKPWKFLPVTEGEKITKFATLKSAF